VARGLVLACHPVPTAAVTLLSAGLTVLAGPGPARGVLVVATVFTGQLSIGWSNDSIDAARDRLSARPDKPVALGALSARAVGAASIVALLLSAAGSLALGWPAGAAAFAIVVCGWAYNLGLKATVLSWLPYALAFGLLPAVSTLAERGQPWPAGWAVAAGALLGVSAHLANVLPDLAEDAATGVRGLPHRIGGRWSAVAAAALLFAAIAAIVLGSGDLGIAGWVVLTATGAVALAAGGYGWSHRPGRPYFVAILVIAGASLALFAVSGGNLT
jgi:4-hydroxybenzoate polyprenyltransferase